MFPTGNLPNCIHLCIIFPSDIIQSFLIILPKVPHVVDMRGKLLIRHCTNIRTKMKPDVVTYLSGIVFFSFTVQELIPHINIEKITY